MVPVGISCLQGEVAVGIVGRESDPVSQSDLGGVNQLGLRCRASNLSGQTTTTNLVGNGAAGVADGPYDCPDGQALAGVKGSTYANFTGGQSVRELEIVCASLSGSQPPQVGLPASVDFIGGALGTVFQAQIPITNTAPFGAGSLQIGQLAIQGDIAGEFAITGDACSNVNLPAGSSASCIVTLSFTPIAGGLRSASLVVPSNGATSPDTVALTGSGVAPAPTIGLSPSSVAFGDQLGGSASASHTVTITNTAAAGSQWLVLSPVSVSGANAADFTTIGTTCPIAGLAPGNSCTVDVRFAPAAAGPRSAYLVVPNNANPATPSTVALSGNGTQPTGADVRLSLTGPSSAASGSQNTYVMNISNAGPATASNVIMTVQVPNGTKFVGVSTTHGSCTYPASGATSGTIRCALGNLASGAAAVDTVAFKITLTGKGGSIAIVAQASSASTSDPDLSNNVASLTTTIKKR